MCSCGWVSWFFLAILMERWVDGLGLGYLDYVGLRVSFSSLISVKRTDSNYFWIRIVEYANRDQAQQAVATLSNQNLMGRLVYVREVRRCWNFRTYTCIIHSIIGS